MRILILLGATAALAACAQPAPPPGSVVASTLAGRVAGAPKTCISTNPAENLHVLDPQTLAYGYGRTIYINRLAAACPALSEFNTLIVEASTGGQYCRGDRVRGNEPGSVIPGPSCNLGTWVPYTQP